jgi:hypothetical protein
VAALLPGARDAALVDELAFHLATDAALRRAFVAEQGPSLELALTGHATAAARLAALGSGPLRRAMYPRPGPRPAGPEARGHR